MVISSISPPLLNFIITLNHIQTQSKSGFINIEMAPYWDVVPFGWWSPPPLTWHSNKISHCDVCWHLNRAWNIIINFLLRQRRRADPWLHVVLYYILLLLSSGMQVSHCVVQVRSAVCLSGAVINAFPEFLSDRNLQYLFSIQLLLLLVPFWSCQRTSIYDTFAFDQICRIYVHRQW